MENICNFRNFNELKGWDSRPIIPNRLFRSSNPTLGTEGDFSALKALKLDLIIDFRAPPEKSDSEAAFAKTFPWLALPILAGNQSLQKQMPAINAATVPELIQFMNLTYEAFPMQYQHEFRAFLQQAEQGKTLLFHCTAGKDRTGFASLLLLSALGVDKDSIMENFLQSNQHTLAILHRAIGFGMTEQAAATLLQVLPEYLDTSTRMIDAHFQGMESYLRHTLNIDIHKITEHYLAS